MIHQTERFLILENGQVVSLLPGEADGARQPGAAIALLPGQRLGGIAGAGGIPMPGGGLLGGWCSFSCRLAAPRRLAVCLAPQFLQGLSAQEALLTRMRALLLHVLTRIARETAPDALPTRRGPWRALLREEAERQLANMGLELERCTLEHIQRTGGNGREAYGGHTGAFAAGCDR